ncbi:DUF6344 domain-containing protein [Streptomyces sudanensis]|uniref:DUF6344 domain-containing protein n=1 Tax=Streptomyces sudanensis TaxID=436397 RepID=UPI0020CED05E|nr:DUF6344 domain-containing protein [Streptomyces sudanensis]MCP9987353.1 DUF6344 domain-containing protein [Streptomyces sudanensis]
MAAGRVTQFWTAIVSFLRGILALIGPVAPAAGRPGAPAARTGLRAAALPAQRTAAVPAAGARCGAGRGRPAGERALPPTIKQRIRAEAHGASPAVRRLPAVGAPAAERPEDGARAVGGPAAGRLPAGAPAVAASAAGGARVRARRAVRPLGAGHAAAAAPVGTAAAR